VPVDERPEPAATPLNCPNVTGDDRVVRPRCDGRRSRRNPAAHR